MLPLMPGPDPTVLRAAALVFALGAGGAFLVIAALVGWTALELACLLDHFNEA